MLYEALAQPSIFLWLSLSGFLCGFLFDFKAIFLYFLKNNKILGEILLFFASFLTFFVFFIVNLKTNYGDFRVFTVFAFTLSFFIQRFLSNNFLANLVQNCYNKLKQRKEKHGRKQRGQKET